MQDRTRREIGPIRRFTPYATLAALLVSGSSLLAADSAARILVPTGGWFGERAEWVSLYGDRVAFGQGSRAHLAAGLESPVLLRSFDVGVPVLDAVLVEDALYVNDGSRVGVLDLRDALPSLLPLRLSPEPRKPLRLTRMTDYLIVAEDGVGLRVLALPPPKGMPQMEHPDRALHHQAPSRSRGTQVALHALQADFGALAAAGGVVYALTAPGVVTAVDFRDLHNLTSATLSVDPSTRAMAANGTTLYLLTDAGLGIVGTSLPGAPTVGLHPGVRGKALQLAGRAIHVAEGEGGLRTYSDRSPTAAIIEVTVGNNFFNPDEVTVSVGDTVRWTKGSGSHNVEGCSPGAGAGRCGGLTSAETFRSGDPTFDPFVFTHTFTVPGTHGYVCVVHAFAGSGMAGSVTVGGGPTCGDGDLDPFTEDCDDGNVVSGDGCEADCTFTTSGELPPTLTLDKAAGDNITLMWGSSCLGTDPFAGVYEGTIPNFQTYSQRGCNHSGGLATLLPAVSDAFYLVVPHNAASEGSYGRDSGGNPRPPGSVTCKTQRLGACP